MGLSGPDLRPPPHPGPVPPDNTRHTMDRPAEYPGGLVQVPPGAAGRLGGHAGGRELAIGAWRALPWAPHGTSS
jgi:hypothetical protein